MRQVEGLSGQAKKGRGREVTEGQEKGSGNGSVGRGGRDKRGTRGQLYPDQKYDFFGMDIVGKWIPMSGAVFPGVIINSIV